MGAGNGGGAASGWRLQGAGRGFARAWAPSGRIATNWGQSPRRGQSAANRRAEAPFTRLEYPRCLMGSQAGHGHGDTRSDHRSARLFSRSGAWPPRSRPRACHRARRAGRSSGDRKAAASGYLADRPAAQRHHPRFRPRLAHRHALCRSNRGGAGRASAPRRRRRSLYHSATLQNLNRAKGVS